MFGLKLILTGLLLFVVSSVAVKATGKYPGDWVGIPLIIVWYGSVLVMLYGAFAAIWL